MPTFDDIYQRTSWHANWALKEGEGRTSPFFTNRVKTLCFCNLAGNLGVSVFDPYPLAG